MGRIARVVAPGMPHHGNPGTPYRFLLTGPGRVVGWGHGTNRAGGGAGYAASCDVAWEPAAGDVLRGGGLPGVPGADEIRGQDMVFVDPGTKRRGRIPK